VLSADGDHSKNNSLLMAGKNFTHSSRRSKYCSVQEKNPKKKY